MRKMVWGSILTVFAIGSLIGLRAAHLAHRDQRFRELAAKVAVEIANPEMEVSWVGGALMLRGYANDEQERTFAVTMARVYAESPSLFDWSAPPQVVDLVDVKIRDPQQRWLRKICGSRSL